MRVRRFAPCAFAFAIAACEAQERNVATVEAPVVSFPTDPRADCPDSRARLYAECADQQAVLAEGLAAAQAGGRLVLVELGAEWCVWCHVLHRHLIGETFSRFEYVYRDGETYAQEEPEHRADIEAAKALAQYMAEHFVFVHIDADNKFGRQPEGGTGWDVLRQTGADALFGDWVPLTFALSAEGALIGGFDSRQAELRDDETGYRGYDRRLLLAEAQRLRAAAGK